LSSSIRFMPPVDSGAHFVSRPKATITTVHLTRTATVMLLIQKKIEILNFCD
jgi:hypothetical protein